MPRMGRWSRVGLRRDSALEGVMELLNGVQATLEPTALSERAREVSRLAEARANDLELQNQLWLAETARRLLVPTSNPA
jgi:hypothetical protein